MQQYLLIMNNYNNYITANFIAFCMEHLIDLFILFSYISHLLQLFDIDVFSPLKCALVNEINTIAKFNSNRISRVNWVSMFI